MNKNIKKSLEGKTAEQILNHCSINDITRLNTDTKSLLRKSLGWLNQKNMADFLLQMHQKCSKGSDQEKIVEDQMQQFNVSKPKTPSRRSFLNKRENNCAH